MKKKLQMNNIITPNREFLVQQARMKALAKTPGLLEMNEELTGEKPLTALDVALMSIVTKDTGLIAVKDIIRKLSPAKLPVLITGESGTGKELFAKALHGNRQGKFVAVNCAGIPDQLLEAEFFGAKRGAYTGCDRDRIGYLKEAENGTLFLDEIGDMPRLLQSKLLRVLQEHKARRIGDVEEYIVSCRFVSATNKTAEQLLADMRGDLYYRIAGHKLDILPLRDRTHEDVELLCNNFGLDLEELTPAELEEFKRNGWPGNVRQLLNYIECRRILMKGEGC